MAHLLGFLGGHLPGAPRDIVEVDEGVNDKQEVHRGDAQQIQQPRDDAIELLGMHARRDEEGSGQGDEENGRRGPDAVLPQLEGRTHDHSHHHQSIPGRHDLRHDDLHLLLVFLFGRLVGFTANSLGRD